jgi:adenine specific DNA methylase Mod
MHLGRNLLFYGDNLDVLRNRIPSASVDLVYLDPPFNSNRSYNVLFRHRSGAEAQAQIEAFDDTWIWSQESERLHRELVQGGAPANVADALEAMPKMPTPFLPYIQAKRLAAPTEQLTLG